MSFLYNLKQRDIINMDDTDIVGLSSLEDNELDELLTTFRYNEDPTPIQTSDCESIDIKGVRIEFPYKAYTSQLQMMEHIIDGVQKGENCLLESPTGTGKTAAILCSLLAWQRKCKEIGKSYWNLDICNKNGKPCTCKFDIFPDAEIIQVSDKKGGFDLVRKAVVDEEFCVGENEYTSSPSKKQKIILIPEERKNWDHLCGSCLKKHFKESSIPKIYYATRTHSQIAQVIKQLKVTQYSHVNMTILSSRQHTCVNENVLNMESRSGLDDRCRKLKSGYNKNKILSLSGKTGMNPVCGYYHPDESFPYTFLGERSNFVWDIEDIVKEGKKEIQCPFYACRDLHSLAEIVFLPYNYLLDRGIRSSAKIMFINSILVFDEAHNIEQMCCDSMTIEIPLQLVDDIRISFDNLLKPKPSEEKSSIIPDQVLSALQSLSIRLKVLSDWINMEGKALLSERAFDGTIEGNKTFLGNALVDTLNNLGFGVSELPELLEYLKALGVNDNTNENSSLYFVPEHLSFLDNLFTILGIIYDEEMKRLPDFRGCLEKKCTLIEARPQIFTFNFNIYCLNAGISFQLLKESARTIIVTSGTLSPTSSFASELETTFKHVLSADHVIGESQIWAGVLTTGLNPNLNLELNASCLRTNEIILNELGQIILNICQKVPNGVLVFLPSYKTIDRLRIQWKKIINGNSIMNQLQASKTIFYEESSKQKIEVFKKNMKRYQETVLIGNGAVLFAVFRGKVSEGVDFKDEQARAVVTVGIPYPYHGLRINLKKKYNDARSRSTTESYLSGQSWYSAQAFRAMNQAFGRCLRHCNDWGALILIDSRIPSNHIKLSGWVLQFLKLYDNGVDLLNSLDKFMKNKNIEAEIKWNHEQTTQGIYDDDEMLSQENQITQIIGADEMLIQVNQTTQVIDDYEMLSQENQTTQIIGED